MYRIGAADRPASYFLAFLATFFLAFLATFFFAAFLAGFFAAFLAFFLATSRPPNKRAGGYPAAMQAGADVRRTTHHRNKTTNFSTSCHRCTTHRNKSSFVSILRVEFLLDKVFNCT